MLQWNDTPPEAMAHGLASHPWLWQIFPCYLAHLILNSLLQTHSILCSLMLAHPQFMTHPILSLLLLIPKIYLILLPFTLAHFQCMTHTPFLNCSSLYYVVVMICPLPSCNILLQISGIACHFSSALWILLQQKYKNL